MRSPSSDGEICLVSLWEYGETQSFGFCAASAVYLGYEMKILLQLWQWAASNDSSTYPIHATAMRFHKLGKYRQ